LVRGFKKIIKLSRHYKSECSLDKSNYNLGVEMKPSLFWRVLRSFQLLTANWRENIMELRSSRWIIKVDWREEASPAPPFLLVYLSAIPTHQLSAAAPGSVSAPGISNSNFYSFAANDLNAHIILQTMHNACQFSIRQSAFPPFFLLLGFIVVIYFPNMHKK
jgi:hypothetical protein